MPILVTAATHAELTAALPPLRKRALPEQKPLSLDDGKTWGCITGVGPINAALAMGICLTTLPSIDAVINTGLAGSFDLDVLPLGTLAVITEEIFPEYGRNDGRHVANQALPFPMWQKKKDPVFHKIQLPAHTHPCIFPLPAHLPRVSSLTVCGVTEGEERRASLFAAYGALLENMEGFAVALACARHHVPCIEIRVVSNKVGGTTPDTCDFSGALRHMETLLPPLLGIGLPCSV